MSLKLTRGSHYKLVRLFSLNVCDNQKQNHYDCLGVTPKATQGDIKTAYYKLSKQFHPDINKDNPSAAEKFKNISAAYEVLGNLKAKKLYDRGILVGNREENHSETAEPVNENYKHASFYHHRNKPTSDKTATGKVRMYDMDEWTRAHYSDTLSESFQKRRSGSVFVKDTANAKTETHTVSQVAAVLALVFGVAMLYEANAYIKFDQTSKKFDQTSKKFDIDEEPD